MPNAREILEKHNVPVAPPGDPHYRPNWANTICPFCNGSKNHLGIALNLSRANCYKCGPKNVATVLCKLTGMPYQEARLLTLSSAPLVQEEKIYGTYKPPQGLVALTPADRKYLKHRNLDPDLLVERYGLQSVGPFSGLPHGVFIPITHRRKPVSWQIRYRNPEEAGIRYKTANNSEKSMSEKDILFGSDLCSHTIVVVEGFFDMANIGPGAACLFGLAYTAKQVLLLSKFARRVVCFDNSTDAQKVAARLAADLAVFPGETFQVCLDADDPGSASKQEIATLRKAVGL